MFMLAPARAGYLKAVRSFQSFGSSTIGTISTPRNHRRFSTKVTGFQKSIMATPFKVHLDANQKAEFRVQEVSQEAADLTTKLLQKNHEKWHIFFNKSGFHNHIVHQLLTIFALGASPSTIQKQFDLNASYQRPLSPFYPSIVASLHDPESFNKYLGEEEHYHDFLQFFKEEMEKKGWQNVINEYVFGGDERGDDLLVRLYAGFLHPIIHLGFGIEFNQPAIIAEALAQACVHENWMSGLFYPAEAAAKATSTPKDKSLHDLLLEIRADEKLSSSPKWEDGNKVRDGVLARAGEEMIKYASQYHVNSSTLKQKTAEMINAAILFTGAAQHPPHAVKFDFYYMHCVNSSLWFSTFLKQDWLSTESKIRLLEWKGRTDLALYASRRSPELLVDEITNYAPPGGQELKSWDTVIEKTREIDDDGHTSKLVRAIRHGEEVCREYEGKEGFVIKGDMWLKLGNMVIDSVGVGPDKWVRSPGFEEAWKDVPLREGSQGKL